MNKYTVLFLFIFVVTQAFSNVSAQNNEISISYEKVLVNGKAFYLHKVKSGQTLFSIAKAYNVLQNEVAEENPEVFQSLPVGHQLKIPIIKGRNNTPDEIKYSDKFIFHYIEKGETLYSLAKKNNTSVEDIVKWNPHTVDNVKPGDVIKIPKLGISAELLESLLPENQIEKQGDIISHDDPGFIFHHVEKGQTLYFISRKYNIGQQTIIRLNPGADKKLSIGQMLKIPKPDTIVVAEQNQQKQTERDIKDTILGGNPDGFIEHEVEKGETLYSISKKHEIEKEKIVFYNKGADAVIPIGTILQIPFYSKKNNAAALNEILRGENEASALPKDTFVWEDRRFYYHKVEKQETLYSLSSFYNIKKRKIKRANPALKQRDMQIGEVLKIPKVDIKDIDIVAKLVKAKHAKANDQEKIPVEIIDTVSFTLSPCDTFKYLQQSDTFNVALMIPFYLYENDTMELNDSIRFEEILKEFFDEDEIDRANLPLKPGLRIFDGSKVFLEFYEGFLLAVDTIKASGINLKLNVFNTQNNVDSVKAILQQPEFENMDLIVGPVFNHNLELISSFAYKKQIPFISPLLLPDTTSINNSYFFQVIPSLETQIRKFSEIISNYHSRNIVLMHYGTDAETEVVGLYQKYLLPMLKANADTNTVRFSVVELDRQKAFDIIKPHLDDDEREIIDHPIKKALIDSIPNLVIIPAKERGLVSNTIRQLNSIYKEVASDYEITICGFPNIQRFETIDLEYLHNLQFHTFLNSRINYENYNVKDFILQYREAYKAEPSQF
ncbi:MAG: LysM peptidoglycan-binding domain-containing protein, partial [Bacteroidota bacterium]|nr:LysM peptidoglycan-binding domain-containing protein [Bacteroidota bacterium]